MLSRLKRLFPRSVKQKLKRVLGNIRDSLAYLFARKRPLAGEIRHVVFVCKGNICRSAFAEYYLRSICHEETLRIESCGIDVDQGIFSPPEAIRVSRGFKIDLSGHHSKGLAACDLRNADLIIPMEYGQYLRLDQLSPGGHGKMRLLRDFAPWPERAWCNIYDPYGHNENEFRQCFQSMKRALDGLQKHIFDHQGR